MTSFNKNVRILKVQIISFVHGFIKVKNEFKFFKTNAFFFSRLFICLCFCSCLDSILDNSSCQEIGVQTDLPVRLDLSTKLQGIWGLIRDQNTGRTLISKLLVDCPTDFNILFGYARLSTSLKAVDTLAVENSLEKEHASEAAKASNFFCVVMKVLCYLLLQVLFCTTAI